MYVDYITHVCVCVPIIVMQTVNLWVYRLNATSLQLRPEKQVYLFDW